MREHRVAARSVLLAFLIIGSTVFGGMWAATQKLEHELVDKRGWLSKEELQAQLLVSTLIPAPRFLSLGGLVGFQVGRWRGLVSAIVGLLLPTSSLVVLGVALLRPEFLDGPLAPMGTAVGVTVIGLLFGNAYQQLRSAPGKRGTRLVGYAFAALLFTAIVAGVPLLPAAIAAFVIGPAVVNPLENRLAGG